MGPNPILMRVMHGDREREVQDLLAWQTFDTRPDTVATRTAPISQTTRVIARIIRALGPRERQIVAQPGSPSFRSVTWML